MFSLSAVATTLLGSRRTVNRTSVVRGLPMAHSTVLLPDKLHEYLLPCNQTTITTTIIIISSSSTELQQS